VIAEIPGQVDIFAALGMPEPVSTTPPKPTPRRRPGVTWRPVKSGTCQDCAVEQHREAQLGRPVPHRRRAVWAMSSADDVRLLCVDHAEKRGRHETRHGKKAGR
jgi:hypothetical protein